MNSPTIGILAGMGPRSTASFLDLVASECQTQYDAQDDIDFPRMLICTQPLPFYEDRPVDHDAMENAIRDGLQYLERAGADFLVIASDIAHIYTARLAETVGVRLLSITDLSLEAIPCWAQKIALVAAWPAAESAVFHRALRRSGHKLIDMEWQREVDTLIAATRMSTDSRLLTQLWGNLTARAEEAGIDTLLVASHELSGAVQYANTLLNIVDGARWLAHGVVAEWLARRVEE